MPAVLALLLLGGPPGCTAPSPVPPEPAPRPEPLRSRAASILSRAIQIRTVNPPGDEAPLAAYFVELLREAGLEARVIPTPTGDSRAGRAAAWARLRGTGERRPLVLLSHLDVVTADPRAWSTDPFAGDVEGGYVVGRGAQDAKGVSVVHLLALIERARRDPAPRRDIVFLATPDEESGGLEGAGWVTRERPDLLDDAAYLLTEGGGVRIGRGGVPAWQVAVGEKSPCWLRIVAEGTPGHSAVPPREAAVPRLLDALERARRLERPVRVVPEVARMFAALAPLAPAADAEGFADLGRALAGDPDFRARFLAEPSYAALVRDTLAITMLEGSPRTNVLATRARAHLDARLLPGSRCEAFTRRIREGTAGRGVSVETLLSLGGGSSPVDTPLYRAIQAVAADRDPRAVVVPRVVAGFTDAHYFRARGLVAYGFVPRWHRVGEQRGVHGPDERISLDNLERGVETLVAILDELDRRE